MDDESRHVHGVEDDGVVSDESDFYGDEADVAELQDRVARYDPGEYWERHERSVLTVVARSRDSVDGKGGEAGTAGVKAKGVGALKQSILTPSASLSPKSSLLSKPSVANTSIATSTSPAKRSIGSSKALQEVAAEPFNPGEGMMYCKQSRESIADFLKRLPPSSSTTHDTGPWIWIYNPTSSYRPLSEDVAKLKTEGLALLSHHTSLRQDLERQNRTAKPGVITRKLKPHLTSLQGDLFALGRRTGVNTGKWMLFPSPGQVDRVWSIIAHATFEGSLGFAAKVATQSDDVNDDGDPEKSRLICVYNDDFEDVDEIKRILNRLRELGVVNDDGVGYGGGRGAGGGGPGEASGSSSRAIYYKPDVWTHLGVFSGNEWKLRASLYGSRDGVMKP